MKRLVVLLLAAGALGAVPTADGADVVRVNADAEWTSTGISVVAGQIYSTEAIGKAFTTMPNNATFRPTPGTGTGRQGESGPEGQIYICTSAPGFECALDGAPFGQLVGRVGSQAFSIGDSGTFTAPASGTLELAVNDFLGYYSDNSGGFTVTFG
jgi:hypothetical protein